MFRFGNLRRWSTCGRMGRLAASAALGLWFAVAMASTAQAAPAPPAHGQKLALVLSGGGAMGIAHVGAIMELERLGIRPDIVVGTSMGSIVGGLYAAGMTGPELKQAVESMDWDAIFDTSHPRDGLTYRQKQQEADFPVKPSFGVVDGKPTVPEAVVSDANLLLQLRRLIGTRAAVPTFDDLPIPFRAVATDIETGEKVVLDRGDLASAMRASMSVPGVFAPKQLDGRLLVDGGMADNVPIDVARDMGADVVIVVVTQGPMVKAKDIRSLPQILGQTVGLLILANERQQLATVRPTDVLVKIDTKGLGSADFKRGKELMAAGRESTLAKEAELRRVAATRGPFQAPPAVIRPPPRIDYVRVENPSKLSDDVLLSYLRPFVGKPMDSEAIIKALQRMRALGGFTRADYRIEEKDGRTGLLVEVEQRPGDTRRLRPGLTFASAGDGRTEFDISLEYRMIQLDAYGSEARFVGTFGSRKEFGAEYFKVLDRRQRWFVEPSVNLSKRPVSVYASDGFRLGEYDVANATGTLAFGRQFDSLGELRLGVEAGAGKANREVGLLVPKDFDIRTGQLFVQGGVDTVDNAYFPTSGGRAQLRYTAGLTELGEDRDFQQVQGSGSYAFSFGQSTVWLNLEAGDAVQGVLPLPSLFTLGGPFSFPGFSIDELTGQSYFAARAMFRHRIAGNAESLFRIPIYVGATLVTGNTWARPHDMDFSDLRLGGNLFVATDTIIGPVFLAVGAADGGRTAFYLFVGKPF